MNEMNEMKKWKKWKNEKLQKNKPNYDEKTQNPGKCRGWSEIKNVYRYINIWIEQLELFVHSFI